MKIDNKTQLCGLITENPTNLSAAMHNAGYGAAKLNFIYLPRDVAKGKVDQAINAMRDLGIRGYSVSIPHKEKVAEYLDRVDDVARYIGSVNTVVNNSGTLMGYNTDWTGAMQALKEVTSLEGKVVLLIGAGGASRAIAYGLKRERSDVIVFNRTVEHAEMLANDFGVQFGGGLGDVARFSEIYDIMVNTTSVGYQNGKIPIYPEHVREGKIVMDIIPVPVETPLLKVAADKGCTIIPGHKMIFYQALPQFELFTGVEAPVDAMEKALLKELGLTGNI